MASPSDEAEREAGGEVCPDPHEFVLAVMPSYDPSTRRVIRACLRYADGARLRYGCGHYQLARR